MYYYTYIYIYCFTVIPVIRKALNYISNTIGIDVLVFEKFPVNKC